jgi:hypothetical protein
MIGAGSDGVTEFGDVFLMKSTKGDTRPGQRVRDRNEERWGWFAEESLVAHRRLASRSRVAVASAMMLATIADAGVNVEIAPTACPAG